MHIATRHTRSTFAPVLVMAAVAVVTLSGAVSSHKLTRRYVATTRQAAKFTFLEANSYLLYSPPWRTDQVEEVVSLRFRTHLANALLLWQTTSVPLPQHNHWPYYLYLELKEGSLHLVHCFGQRVDEITLGKGLSHNKWHSVEVKKNAKSNAGIMTLSLDGGRHTDWIMLTTWTYYNYLTSNLTNRNWFYVYVGGSRMRDSHNVSHDFPPFVGCMENIRFSRPPDYIPLDTQSSDTTPMPIPIEEISPTKSNRMRVGCVDACLTGGQEPCQNGRCINYYTEHKCDCFGTGMDGDQCSCESEVMTFSGSEYIIYQQYSLEDKVHTMTNRFSITFRTKKHFGVLMYAKSSSANGGPGNYHVSLALEDAHVKVSLDFGNDNGNAITAIVGTRLNDNKWHNVTIEHHGDTVNLYLDRALSETISISGDKHHLHLDASIYIGGGLSDELETPGLVNPVNFVGCLKDVYHDHSSVLHELNSANPRVLHYGDSLSGCQIDTHCQRLSNRASTSSLRH